ncbi:hypothetical protein KEJ26_01600 [Candidatus Bathyarchaeota archaeon]|nr:hypothetical protein [Candidatus Bathyarchaeota archaeon]
MALKLLRRKDVRLAACSLGLILLAAGVLIPLQTPVTESNTIIEYSFVLRGRWWKAFPVDINVAGKTTYKLTVTFSSDNIITAAIITDSTMYTITHDVRASIVCEAWLPSSKGGSFDYAPKQSGRYWIFFGNVQPRQELTISPPRFGPGWIDQVSQIMFTVNETYTILRNMINWPLMCVGILSLLVSLVGFLSKRKVVEPIKPLYICGENPMLTKAR